MLYKCKIALLISIGMITFLFGLNILNAQENITLNNPNLAEAQDVYAPPFFDKEIVNFDVKLRGFKIGTAQLVFHGKFDAGKKDFNLIVFDVDTLNIKDKETIYADVDSYLPIKIERNLDIWGKKYEVVEEYNQAKFSLAIFRILKNQNRRILENKFQKDAVIHNVLLTVYKYRLSKEFKIGETLILDFPTKKVEAKVMKIEKIVVPAGAFEAYVIETVPRQFKIWIGTDSKRLPLKIEGGVGLGSAVMVLNSIKEKGN